MSRRKSILKQPNNQWSRTIIHRHPSDLSEENDSDEYVDTDKLSEEAGGHGLFGDILFPKENSRRSTRKSKSRTSRLSRRSGMIRDKSGLLSPANSSKQRKQSIASLTGGNAELEWGVRHEIFIKFDLEAWWRKSSMPTRMNIILLGLLLVIALSNLFAGLYFISKSFRQTIRNPYVCVSPECKQASQWLTKTMNTSVNPCENFYEFVCGNYPNESETEGDLTDELIVEPAFKIEFGENSMLAKVLKNFRNDSSYDQSIRYYQACLNEPKREAFGLEAFLEVLGSILGTRDLSNFETTTLSLEEIGANLLRHSGEAGYINMAFYTYPYIVILQPSKKIQHVYPPTPGEDNLKPDGSDELLRRILKHLLRRLGITDSKQIKDAYNGIVTISKIEDILNHYLREIQMPKKLDPSQELVDTVMYVLQGLCPPMGVQLDMQKMLRLFIQDDFRLDFYDLMALKHFLALKLCFAEDPSKFTYFKVDFQRTSFVATWIFGIFWDFLIAMDTKNLMKDWEIGLEALPINLLVEDVTQLANDHIELRCMIQLSTNVGYLTAIRHLLSTFANPVEHLHSQREEIQELYRETFKWFQQIPQTEIEPALDRLGDTIFQRELHVDVLMPLVSGLLDESAASDLLDFGEDHLRNSLTARKYTVEKARLNWLGSTNTEPTIKWWGFGGPFFIENELFDVRNPLIKALEFEEMDFMIENKKFYKFLGRPQPNYILFFLTMFDEPYVDETVFLKLGGLTVKIIRTIYFLLTDPLLAERYYSVLGVGERVRVNETINRTCSLLYHGHHKNPNNSEFFQLILDNNMTVGEYLWFQQFTSLSMLALKQTLHKLESKRKKLTLEEVNWQMSLGQRKLRMNRLLPGTQLSNYNEKQMFFMAYVRNTCRGSWKTHDDELKKKRFKLEATVLAVLMQMEEFQSVWNCKNEDFMSNAGKARCFQWVP